MTVHEYSIIEVTLVNKAIVAKLFSEYYPDFELESIIPEIDGYAFRLRRKVK